MKQKKYSSVIVTGSIAYDEIMDFPGQFMDHLQADKLHQINVSFVVDKLEKQFGGTATNISYNTKIVTDKEVYLLSSLGKDGKDFLAFYTKHGIHTEHIFVDEELYTAAGKVITDMKDNQIWGFYYGACERHDYINLQKFDAASTLVILSATHAKPFLRLQEQTITQGFEYVYDPGMILTWVSDEDLRTGVMNCTWLVGNDYEIAQIEKRLQITAAELVQKGIAVIITLGGEGVRYKDVEGELVVPAFKLDKIVDPTGAGDAWRGGFMAGIVEGKEIIDCLKQANALASFAVEKYGTVNHMPSGEDIEERVKSL